MKKEQSRKSIWDNDNFRERKVRINSIVPKSSIVTRQVDTTRSPASLYTKNTSSNFQSKKRPKRRTTIKLHSTPVHCSSCPSTNTPDPRTSSLSHNNLSPECDIVDVNYVEPVSLLKSTEITNCVATKEIQPPSTTSDENEKCTALGLQNPHLLLLEHTWTLYFDVDWRYRHKMSTMNNVAEFWGVINNVPVPTKSPLKCNWSLFKYDIKPEWEDPQNRHGGKWNMDLGTDRVLCDKIWLYMLMGVVGETLDVSNEINGITLHLRPNGIRCALWTVGTNMKTQKRIGRNIRKLCEIPSHIKLEYKLQVETIEKNSSYETQVTLIM